MSLRADMEFTGTDKSDLRRWITPITVSVVLLALTTAVLWMINTQVQQDHLIFVYFLPTTLIAIRYGSISAMCVAISSSFAAAYLLYAPRFSFAVDSPLDLLELIFFSLLALLASQVVSGFAKDRDVEQRRQRVRRTPKRAPWLTPAGLWKRIRPGA